MIGESVPVLLPDVPPSLESHVAISSVIASPPLPLFVNATVTLPPIAGVTVPTVGALGSTAGTIAFEGADSALSPTPFVAWTVHV